MSSIGVGPQRPEAPGCEASEVELLRTLQHAHIVRYRDSFFHEAADRPPVLGIVMDYCRGGDLRQAIRRQRASGGGPFPEARDCRHA